MGLTALQPVDVPNYNRPNFFWAIHFLVSSALAVFACAHAPNARVAHCTSVAFPLRAAQGGAAAAPGLWDLAAFFLGALSFGGELSMLTFMEEQVMWINRASLSGKRLRNLNNGMR